MWTDFKSLVDAYGADRRRWPEDRRAAAEAFCAEHPEAQAMLADEAALDRLLHATRPPEPDQGFAAGLAAMAPAEVARAAEKISVPGWPVWAEVKAWLAPLIAAPLRHPLPAGLVAASLFVGVGIGGFTGSGDGMEMYEDDTELLALAFPGASLLSGEESDTLSLPAEGGWYE